MGNEMGNRNINGLQEQQDSESVAANKSWNASVHSNNADDKGQLTTSMEIEDFNENTKWDHISTATTDDNLIKGNASKRRVPEQQETDIVATDKSSKASVHSNDADDADDKGQLTSSMEIKDFDGNTKWDHISTATTDDNLIEGHASKRRVPEQEETDSVAPDKSLKPLVHSNDADDKGRFVSSTKNEDFDENTMWDHISTATMDGNLIEGQASKRRVSEQKETDSVATDKSSKASVHSNDAGDKGQLTSSMKIEDFEENTKWDHISTATTDNDLIEGQAFKRRVSEQQETYSVATDKSLIGSVHSNDADDKGQLTSTMENEDFNENTKWDPNSTATDDNLIEGQASKRTISEQQETDSVATDKSSKALVHLNDANDKGQLTSSTEIEDFNENKKWDQISTATTDYNLIEGQASKRRFSEQQETDSVATDKSLKGSVHSNDADNKGKLTSLMETEDFDENMIHGHMSTATTDDNFIEGRASKRRISEHQEIDSMATDKSSKASVHSNDADGNGWFVSSMEIEDFDKHTMPYHISMATTDDNLIEGQASKRRVKDEITSDLSSSSEAAETVPIPSMDLKSDEREPANDICYAFTAKSTQEWKISNEDIAEKSDELGNAMVEKLSESVTPDANPSFVDNMQGLTMEESDSCEEMVLMGSGIIEGNTEEGRVQIGLAFDQVRKENTLQQEPISSYLDAVDIEIKRLLVENDQIIVDDHETFNKEDGYDGKQNRTSTKHEKETSHEESTTNDIEIYSFGIQNRAIDLSQEEKQMKEDSGLEESVIKLVEADERKDLTSRHEEHDDHPSLMHDSEGEREILKMETITSVVDILVADEEREDKRDYIREGSNKEDKLVENNQINEGQMFVCSLFLAGPIVGREMVAETGELNAAGENSTQVTIVRMHTDDKKLLETSEINGVGFSASFSQLFDRVDDVIEEMVKKTDKMNAIGNTTEERSEQLDGKLGDPIEACYATITEPPHSSKSRPSEQNEVFICGRELEQKYAAKESEMLANKEGLTTEPGDASECLNVCSEMLNIADGTFVSDFKLDNDKYLQDETSPSLTQIIVQETEVSKTEYSGLLLDSTIQSQNNEQESIPACPAGMCVSATTPKALDNSGWFTAESDQEKPNSQATGCFEKLMEEIVVSEPQSSKEDSEDSLSLSYAFVRWDPETRERSASSISGLEDRDEEAKPSPSLDHKQTSKGGGFAFERCVPETNKSIPKYHIETSQEAFSKTSAETAVAELESTNEESDKSPLLYQKSQGEVSALGRTDSGKLRTPLVSLLNEEVYVLESFEKQEGIVLKNTVEEVWKSPVKRTIAASPRKREKQKPRSTLFSNCMCCTTAIN